MTNGDYRKLGELLTNEDIVHFAVRVCDHFHTDPITMYRKTTRSEVMRSAARRQLYVGQTINLIRRAIFLGSNTIDMLKMCTHLVVLLNSIEKELDFRQSGLTNEISDLEKKYSVTDILTMDIPIEDFAQVLVRDQDFYGVPLKEDISDESC